LKENEKIHSPSHKNKSDSLLRTHSSSQQNHKEKLHHRRHKKRYAPRIFNQKNTTPIAITHTPGKCPQEKTKKGITASLGENMSIIDNEVGVSCHRSQIKAFSCPNPFHTSHPSSPIHHHPSILKVSQYIDQSPNRLWSPPPSHHP